MTSRERVQRTLKFENPDRIPVDYWVLPSARIKYGERLSALLRKYPKDFPEAADMDDEYVIPPSYRAGEYADCFGSVWSQKHDGILGQIVKHPLENSDDLKTYQFPDPREGETTIKQIGELISHFRSEKKFVCADFVRTFERMHFLRGMENLLMDMAYQKEEFFTLLDRVAEWNVSHLRPALDEFGDGIDGVWFSDDWGSQNSLLIRPDMWRKIFRPKYKEMFEVVKSSGKPVFFHSDGYIMDIIGDLIEAGVDALNCQIKLMGAERLAERFGGRVTFHTDLDRQGILPYGTPGEIGRHIEEIRRSLGKFGGGLILCAELGADMPFENIQAVIEGFDRVR